MKKVIDRNATCNNINALIDRSGLSRGDIARTIRVNPAVVYGWKNGRIPSIQNLFNLARLLDTSVHDLIIVNKDAFKDLA